ncbi:MAG: DUF4105 domain-containing protein [Flavobacteriaceae bacterium]|nr:DUF4105 domain-containing protein [Flavobacteriaceae bacterium]
MIKNFLYLILLLFCFFGYTQDDEDLSNQAKISFITIGPGSNLYDSFGHSAIRIYDPEKDIDWAFNYGLFDFNQKNFYLNFAKGRMHYKLGMANYPQFLESYRKENRWVKEQELRLTQKQKLGFYDYLLFNVQPENAAYAYDPFFNNCATKLPEVAHWIIGDLNIKYRTPEGFQQKSFRKLMHDYIPRNTWGCFGIDIALGSVMDRKAKIKEHMYLPEYVFDFYTNSKLPNGASIIQSTQQVLTSTRKAPESSFLGSPLFVMGLLGIIILFITYRDFKQNRHSFWLDKTLALITGLAGIILLWLWLATDHTNTQWNYDILWAFPLNILLVFAIGKKTKKWVAYYYKILLLLLVLLSVHWFTEVQIFAIGLIPLLFALAIRYIYNIKSFKQKHS